MNSKKDIFPKITASIFILLVFLLDLSTPLGVAEGVLYIFALFWLIRIENNLKPALLYFATVCTFLTLLSIYIHWPVPGWMAYVNRGISLLAIWGSVLLIFNFQKRQNQQKKKVLESENRFKSLINSTTDAIVTADERGNILTWNAAAESIFGWTEEEMIQRSLVEIMPVKFRQSHQQSMNNYMKSGQSKVIGKVVELEGMKKDGSTFPLELALGTWKMDGVYFFSGIIRDISTRKANEQKIHLSQFTIEKADEMILWLNPAGRVLHANEAACQKMGYSKEEFQAITVPDFDPRYTYEMYQKVWKEVKLVGSRVAETKIQLKSGELMPVEVKSNYINYNGIEYNCAFFRDITNRKQKELELRLSQENLLKTHLQLVEINKAYSRFIPHDFLNILGHNSILDLKLGDSTEVKMTVLFADIRDYSAFSEQMTPEENFKFINAYLGRLGPIIKEHGGFINQYYGDGIMALFVENHENGLKAGINIQKAIQVYNKQRIQKYRKPVKIGIGIHVGDLMLGIIGDNERTDAGVISDVVNMASRLEGLTKTFGSSVIFSEALWKELKQPDFYPARHLGKIMVKGSTKTISVFQTFEGLSEQYSNLQERTKEIFSEGLDCYFNHRFNRAKGCFQKVISLNPLDKAATYYLAKSQEHLEADNENWEGIEVMLSK